MLTRAALYARVSTEDAFERRTIEAQLHHLRQYTTFKGIPIYDTYTDEAVSGSIALQDRPEGARLLEDARKGYFNTVMVYRVDRLSRKLSGLLAVYELLAALGVAIHSATEDFNTATPTGNFLFQLLGSMAELERQTIIERVVGGKSRVARTKGTYTGGALPLGYDVDTDGHLILSQREVYPGCTEADLARSIFERIAAGSSTNAECKRLDALGVKPTQKFNGGKPKQSAGGWYDTKVAYLIRNTVYKGVYLHKSRYGTVERPAPALVSAALWQQANDQILKNRAVPNGNQQRDYILRGLMICAQCGLYYSGTRITAMPFYRCGGHRLRQCQSKILNAEWAEMHVWDMVSRWLWKAKEDPFDQVEIIDTAAEKAQLQRQLLNKEEGRQRIITAFRESDFLTHTDIRQQIKAIDEEKRAIEAQLQHLEQQDIVLGVFKDKYKRLMELDLSGEQIEKRRLITEYTSTITVATDGVGRKKNATITVRFLNGEERTIQRCWWHTTVHEVEYPGGPVMDLTDMPQEP